MKYAILSLMFLLSLSHGLTANEINSAGVIAYAIHKGKTQILLADHSGLAFYRGYAAFGGSIDGNESHKEAALREFHEETRCAFKDVAIKLSEKKIINNNFVSFIVELPYFTEPQLALRQQKSGCKGGVFQERGPLIWFAFKADAKDKTTIQAALLQPPEKFWSKSTAVLDKALRAGLLPLP
ncbi:MAG: NUDIX domain-containing protein [Pseudomonadales bacterium]|nr:NUDIX domain-containing protein [Pseudomonadales bacterium]